MFYMASYFVNYAYWNTVLNAVLPNNYLSRDDISSWTSSNRIFLLGICYPLLRNRKEHVSL